jgi:hypothetical protein
MVVKVQGAITESEMSRIIVSTRCPIGAVVDPCMCPSSAAEQIQRG